MDVQHSPGDVTDRLAQILSIAIAAHVAGTNTVDEFDYDRWRKSADHVTHLLIESAR